MMAVGKAKDMVACSFNTKDYKRLVTLTGEPEY
jgi:hypothetical protein